MPSEHTGGNVFVLEGQWSPQYTECFESGRANGIRLSRSMGWQAESLEFIGTLPNLTSVEIYHSEVKDLSVLAGLSGLLHLGLECPYKKLDFSGLNQLSSAALNWRPGAETLLSLSNVKYLNIAGYPYEDLSELSGLEHLTRLFLQSRKLTSLNGVHSLPDLKKLELSRCSGLGDLAPLSLCRELEYLLLDSCKKITEIQALAGLPALKVLNIECEGGTLQSLAALSDCPALMELYLIGIRVKDGDLHPILTLTNLKRIALANFKNHSPTRDEILTRMGLS